MIRVQQFTMLSPTLLRQIDAEIERGIKKWGAIDKHPTILLNAAVEELGEVAHAVNHGEGAQKIHQEIAEAIAILARLYAMVIDCENTNLGEGDKR